MPPNSSRSPAGQGGCSKNSIRPSGAPGNLRFVAFIYPSRRVRRSFRLFLRGRGTAGPAASAPTTHQRFDNWGQPERLLGILVPSSQAVCGTKYSVFMIFRIDSQLRLWAGLPAKGLFHHWTSIVEVDTPSASRDLWRNRLRLIPSR